jgi:Holliday junction resolvasome RuvABC endonuclease subunit
MQTLTIEFDKPIQDVKWQFIGIDPGTVNLGVARLDVPTVKNEVYYANLYQIKLIERGKTVLERINSVLEVLEYIGFPEFNKSVVIEGSAYGEQFRQVELAEIRAGMILWFDSRNAACQIIAPNSIRKHVFGSAKVHADEYWECLAKYPDAAAALSCALCPLTIIDEEKEE